MNLRDDILARRKARDEAKREESIFFAKWIGAVDVLLNTIQKEFSDLFAEGLLESRRSTVRWSGTTGAVYEIAKLELFEPEGLTIHFSLSGYDPSGLRGWLILEGSGQPEVPGIGRVGAMLIWSERFEIERSEKERDERQMALAWSGNCSSWRIIEWSEATSEWGKEKHLVRANFEAILRKLLDSKR